MAPPSVSAAAPAGASAPASASGAGAGAGAGAPSRSTAAAVDAVARNALRYTVSAREYATLHRYLLARSRVLRRHAPSPASVDRAAAAAAGDYNATAVRHALRVFAATWLGSKACEAVVARLRARGSSRAQPSPPAPSALRLSLSLSAILLLYRLLFRFLSRLRAHLGAAAAAPFRRRNPRAAAALTSAYAPAVGAALAGLALAVCPARQIRVSLAVGAAFRALEFAWNVCEADGLVWGSAAGADGKRERPWWFGSWMLQPLAFGQLLHACVFDRDCFPEAYGSFIFGNSSAYIHAPPRDWPANAAWPTTSQVINSLAQMARLHWPAYISPTMFPHKEVLPPSLRAVAPLTSQAHPLITSLSCATLHPADPSCLRTYLTFWLDSFPPLARFFLIANSALALVARLGALYDRPVATLQRVVTRALRMAVFTTGAMSTSWASICFFQAYLPRHFLATQRFFIGGFLAGMWAWFERRHARAVFLYSARASVDSLWKVGVKRRWWRAMRGGDVCVFVLALMLTGVVYERDARAIRERQWRKSISWVRGEGWRDWAADDESDDDGHTNNDKDD